MVGDFSRAIVTIHNFHSLQDLPAMESHQKDDCMIHECMDCIKGVTRETSTKPPCKKNTSVAQPVGYVSSYVYNSLI